MTRSGMYQVNYNLTLYNQVRAKSTNTSSLLLLTSYFNYNSPVFTIEKDFVQHERRDENKNKGIHYTFYVSVNKSCQSNYNKIRNQDKSAH